MDDQLIACNTRTSLDEFKRQLNAKFECSDSGAVGYFLGFNVHRDRPNRKLYISQEHYLQALLERFGMETSNPARNPLPSGFKALPATDEEAEAANWSDQSSMLPPSVDRTYPMRLASYHGSLANGTRLIGPLPSTCFDTLGVRQNYVSPLMAKPANGSSWVMPMPIGGATSTHGDRLPDTSSKPLVVWWHGRVVDKPR